MVGLVLSPFIEKNGRGGYLIRGYTERKEQNQNTSPRTDSSCCVQVQLVPVEEEAQRSPQGRNLHALTLLCDHILFGLFWKGFTADKNQEGTFEHQKGLCLLVHSSTPQTFAEDLRDAEDCVIFTGRHRRNWAAFPLTELRT